jgi:hypothetical protein
MNDYFSSRPDLNLEFFIGKLYLNLGAILYPQEMNKHIDTFFESEKENRIKKRKELRAKINKVHDVLYKYSHEKLEKFLSVKELAYLFLYYEKASISDQQDENSLNSIEIIREKCQKTLE